MVNFDYITKEISDHFYRLLIIGGSRFEKRSSNKLPTRF